MGVRILEIFNKISLRSETPLQLNLTRKTAKHAQQT